LLALTTIRGQLADQADCLGDCTCGGSAAALQAAVDLAIYATDRAIDLYALGKNDFGKAECRASAYAYLLLAISAHLFSLRPAAPAVNRTLDGLIRTLDGISLALAPPGAFTTPPGQSAAPPWKISGETFCVGTIGGVPALVIREQELALQQRLEARWSEVAGSLAPSCPDRDDVLGNAGIVSRLIETALKVNNPAFAPALQTITVPPDLETLLDGLINDVTSDGNGR
jgi:hypothetical protein